MTARTQRPTRRLAIFNRLDPRSLPIAVKIAIGLIIVLAVSSYATGQVTQQLVREGQTAVALSDLETFSRSEALRIVDVLGQQVIALQRLGNSAAVQDRLVVYVDSGPIMVTDDTAALQPDAVLSTQATQFRETRSEFDSVAIMNPDGFILAIDPIPSTISEQNRPGVWTWFSTTLMGTTYLANPETDQLTDYTGINIAIPVYNARDPEQLVGVIQAEWNLSNVLDIVQIGGSRQGLVIEQDGSILISPTDPLGASTPSTIVNLLREGADNEPHDHTEGSGGSFIVEHNDGQQWIYGYTRLDDLGIADESVLSLNWIVMARQPLGAVQARATALLNQLLFTLGLSVVVVSLVVLFFANILLTPLRRLTSSARELREGDLTAAIPEFPNDEVGQLANVLQSLVEQLLERVAQLRSAVQVSRASATTLEVGQMLEGAATALAQQFRYPELRLYLVDTGTRYLRLSAAAGSESERLLRSGTRTPIDETTLEGRAVLLNEVQMGAGDERMREAGLLTERSEVAIPLQASGRALGVMYIFAGRGETFTQEDIDILQLISDQLGGSIENARLFEQSTANLEEIEALNRQLTRQVWEEFLGEEGLRHTPDPEQAWPVVADRLQIVSDIKAEHFIDEEGRSVLAAPLILRGEMIGTLAVTRPDGMNWTRDEVSLLEAVANRMSIVAEGIRLVEESTRLAQREQQVNEISAAMLQRAASVDNVLQTALTELGGALGSDHLSLRIGPPPVDSERRIAPAVSPPADGDGGGSSSTGANGDGGE